MERANAGASSHEGARTGQPAPLGQLRVDNPATGAVVASIPAASVVDLRAAMTRARQAQPSWAALGTRKRGTLLRRLTRRLIRDEALMTTLMAETGKPRYEAEAIELFYTAELTRFLTARRGRRALADEIRRPLLFAYKRARVVQHPHGVVGVIGPWNWPLLNNYADCLAPLQAGNAVLLKPSPLTPLTSLRVEQLWKEEGLPEDVFQVLPGGGELGQALVDEADMIFFTGSQATGRKVAARCGERLVPAVLELGGKSPFIVLADADLRAAARAAVFGAFANSGQVCIRPERVLIEASVAEPFVELCQQEMSRLRQGVDRDGGIDVGAMTFPAQVEAVERQISSAVAQGARLVAGGRRRADLGGRFFEPTLLAGVTSTMDVAREETFGPLLPIIAVPDVEAAVRLANELGLGLSASVFSANETRASAIARRLTVGSACVNDVLVNYFCVEAPLGGVRGSGLGVRHGPEALRQFCRPETIVENAPLLGAIGRWLGGQLTFPYQNRVLRLIRRFMRLFY